MPARPPARLLQASQDRIRLALPMPYPPRRSPIPACLSPRLCRFLAHRDLLLCYTWAYATLWQTCIVCNYMHLLGAEVFRNPLYAQSFGWLTVVGLTFQVRPPPAVRQLCTTCMFDA